MFKEIQRKDRLSLVLYFLLLLVNYIMAWGFRRLGLDNPYLMATVPLVISILVSLVLFSFYREDLRRDFKEYRRRKVFSLVFAIIGVVLIHLILRLTRRFISLTPATSGLGSGPGINIMDLGLPGYFYMVLVSLTPIFSAFIEELIFRKILLDSYPSVYGYRFIFFLVSSVLFGLIHYFNLGSLVNTVPYMVVGLYFGLVYLVTDNIFYSLGIHFLNNFILSVLPTLALGLVKLFY